jgi:hypothetical protein
MTPQEALTELLERLGAARDGKVYVNNAEMREWPRDAVAAMMEQRLLARARPTKSVVCPGCERQCVMLVHTTTRANGTAASFVVCDKRDDINRVPIAATLLKQWRCDSEGVCEFIAKSLNIRRSNAQPANDSIKVIGMVRGNHQRQMLCLRVGGQLSVVAGNKSQPLMELIDFDSGKFNVDAKAIRGLVDSATTTDSTYTPSVDRLEERKLETQAMYENWRRAYRELKKQRSNMGDVWYSKQIAKMDIARRRDAETIRKHMKV